HAVARADGDARPARHPVVARDRRPPGARVRSSRMGRGRRRSRAPAGALRPRGRSLTPPPPAAGAAVLGIFSPQRSFTPETAAASLRCDPGSVVAAGPFAVAHAGGQAGHAGDVACVMVGSVWNAGEVL